MRCLWRHLPPAHLWLHFFVNILELKRGGATATNVEYMEENLPQGGDKSSMLQVCVPETNT